MASYFPKPLLDEAHADDMRAQTANLVAQQQQDAEQRQQQDASQPIDFGGLVKHLTSAWTDPSEQGGGSSTQNSSQTATGLQDSGALSVGSGSSPQTTTSPLSLRSLLHSLTSAWSDPTQNTSSVEPGGPSTASSSAVSSAPAGGATPAGAPSGAALATPAAMPTGPAPAGGEIDNSSRASFARTAYPSALVAAGGDPELAKRLIASAISENGTVGSGGPIGVGYNFGGIKYDPQASGSGNYGTWESEGGQRVNQDATFAHYNSPAEGFAAIPRFIQKNFPQAWATYQQTHNAAQLYHDINVAGYATDPQWSAAIEGITSRQVEPSVQGVQTQQPALSGQYAPGNLTPNQITQSTSEGLDYETALAVCGPAAAIAFARKVGRNPTMQEALGLARQVGWTADAGMAGPASEQSLLRNMGVASRLVDGAPDWGAVAADVQRGNPVIVSTPGHYFVAEQYDPQTGRFNFGNSAAILKAARGQTWFSPQEMEHLGMGAPRASLFMDSPTSPAPSVVAGQSQPVAQAPSTPQGGQPLAATSNGSAVSLPTSATGSASTTFDGSTASPLMLRQPLSQTSGPDTNGSTDSSQNDVQPAPASISSGLANASLTWQDSQTEPADQTTPSVPTDASASVSDASAPGPGAPPTPAPQVIPNEDVTSYPPAPQPNGGLGIVDTSGPEQGPQQPSESPMKPVYDLMGNIQGYVHTGLQAAQSAASVAQTAISQAPPTGFPALEGLRSVDQIARGAVGIGQAGNVETDQMLARLQEIYAQADDWAQQNGTPDPTYGMKTTGDPAWRRANPDLAAEVDQINGQLAQMIGQTSQGTELARAANEATAVARPIVQQGVEAVRGGLNRANEPPGLQRPAGGAPTGTATPGANAGSADRADVRFGPGASESFPDRTGAVEPSGPQGSAAELQGRPGVGSVGSSARSTSTYGVFGVAPPEAGPAAEAVGRPRFVPPEVREQLTPQMELPDDPRFAVAVEAHGGQITDRGAEVYTTRAQGADAAGKTATRSGVFVEAVPEGGTSSYARTVDNPNGVGGTQVIPPTKTLYRKPIMLDNEPGSSEGFNQAMEQLQRKPAADEIQTARQQEETLYQQLLDLDRQYNDAVKAGRDPSAIENEYTRVAEAHDAAREQHLGLLDRSRPIDAQTIDDEVQQAHRAGPPGSSARAQALKDVVSKYGGDPNTIDDLLKIRADTQSESQWAIKENIVAGNARRQGYDGVFTVKNEDVFSGDVMNHPAVVEASKALNAADTEYTQAMATETQIRRQFTGALESGPPRPGETQGQTFARVLGAPAEDQEAYRQALARAEASPEYQAARERTRQAISVRDQAAQAVNDAEEQARVELSKPKISEIFDVQQGRNPTPGAPHPLVAQMQAEKAALQKQWDDLSAVAYAPSHTITPEETAQLTDISRRMQRVDEGLSNVHRLPTATPPGYSIHPDLADRVRPTGEPSSTTAAGMAGVVPVPMRTADDVGASVAASKGFFDRATPILSQGLTSAVSGGVGAATNQQLNPDDPNAALKGFVAGAVAPYAISRGAAALARRAGREIPQAEGALASLGHIPPPKITPSAADIAEAQRVGAQRGARLNQEVSAPESSIPRRIESAQKITDDKAAQKYAEDILTTEAGKGKLPEYSEARPSLVSRRNPDSMSEELLANDLEGPLTQVAKHGLQNEVPQALQDIHEKDVLTEFYRRGYQEAIDAGDQKAQAQLDNVDKVVQDRLSAADKRATLLEKNGNQAQADSVRRVAQNNASKTMTQAQTVADSIRQQSEAGAEQAGLARMNQRVADPNLAAGPVLARLQAQEQRIAALPPDAQQAFREALQAHWDHNRKVLQMAVDAGGAGGMTQELADSLMEKYPHYVPTVPLEKLTPDLERAFGGPGQSVGRGGNSVSAPLAKMTKQFSDVASGSERLNPIIATRNATIVRMRQIVRNENFNAFAQMVEDAQKAGSASATGPKNLNRLAGDIEVHGYRNGEPTTMRFTRPVAEAIDQAGDMGLSGNAFARNWMAAKNWFTSTITGRRGGFLPKNMVRDFGDMAMITAGHEGGPQALPKITAQYVANLAHGAGDIGRGLGKRPLETAVGAVGGGAVGATTGPEDQTPQERLGRALGFAAAGALLTGGRNIEPTGLGREFLARGGGMSTLSPSVRSGERWLRDINANGGAVVQSPKDLAKYLSDWGWDTMTLKAFQRINDIGELPPRVTAMQLAEKRGATPTEAMVYGRDASMDFLRGGSIAKQINKFVPFFNASIQGKAQLARAFRDHPYAATATFAATVVPLVAAVEAYNRMDPQRAQEYADVPDYEKKTGIVLMLPWAGSDLRGDRPNHLYIPVGNYAPLLQPLRDTLAKVPGLEDAPSPAGEEPTGETGTDARTKALHVFNEAIDALNPLGGDTPTAIVSGAIPPIAKQAIEIGTNQNLFTGSPIASTAADERASAAAQGTAGAINELGRATGNLGMQNVRPGHVEYAFQQAPAFGDLIRGVSDAVAPSPYKAAENRPIQNAPFVGGAVSGLVRDTGGENLRRAQAAMWSQPLQDAVAAAEMRPDQIAPVPTVYKQAPLTRDEQLRWQEATNSLIPRYVSQVQRDPAWRQPASRQEALTKALSDARDAAADRALRNLTDTEIERRKRTDQALKAS